MKRILYVEDTRDNRELVCQMLDDLYQIETAIDGEEGLRKAQESPPDLMLIDISLPVMDGLTLTRRIRADAHLNQIPIVALTAHCMVGDREKALAAGCDDFLSKPFRMMQLRDMVADRLAAVE
ncbi:MAG: response regulator [Bradymonadia bacterium]